MLHLVFFELQTFVAQDAVLVHSCVLGVGLLWSLTAELVVADDSLRFLFCALFEGDGYCLLVFDSLVDLVHGFVLEISGCFILGCLWEDFGHSVD